MKNKFKRFLAGAMAAVMLMGVSMSTLAVDEDKKGNIGGVGSLEGKVDMTIAKAIFPTNTADDNRFYFTLDPQNLIKATYAERYGLAPILDVKSTQDSKLFFQRFSGDVSIPVYQYKVTDEYSEDFITAKRVAANADTPTPFTTAPNQGTYNYTHTPSGGSATNVAATASAWNVKVADIVAVGATTGDTYVEADGTTQATSARALDAIITQPIKDRVEAEVTTAVTAVNTAYKTAGGTTGNTADGPDLFDPAEIAFTDMGNDSTWDTTSTGFPTAVEVYLEWTKDGATAAAKEKIADVEVNYALPDEADEIRQYDVSITGTANWPLKSSLGNDFEVNASNNSLAEKTVYDVNTAAKALALAGEAYAQIDPNAGSSMSPARTLVALTTNADDIEFDTSGVATITVKNDAGDDAATITITKGTTVYNVASVDGYKITYTEDFLRNSSPYWKYHAADASVTPNLAAGSANADLTSYGNWTQIEVTEEAMKDGGYKSDVMVGYADQNEANYVEAVKAEKFNPSAKNYSGEATITITDNKNGSATEGTDIFTRKYENVGQATEATLRLPART